MLVIGRLQCFRRDGCEAKHRAQYAAERYVADGESRTPVRPRREGRITVRRLRHVLASRQMLPDRQSGRFRDQSSIYLVAAKVADIKKVAGCTAAGQTP